MKHIRSVSVEKANLITPIADLYFTALRAYEDLKLFLKFEPLPEIPDGGLIGFPDDGDTV